jgi:hypothetical protein
MAAALRAGGLVDEESGAAGETADEPTEEPDGDPDQEGRAARDS